MTPFMLKTTVAPAFAMLLESGPNLAYIMALDEKLLKRFWGDYILVFKETGSETLTYGGFSAGFIHRLDKRVATYSLQDVAVNTGVAKSIRRAIADGYRLTKSASVAWIPFEEIPKDSYLLARALVCGLESAVSTTVWTYNSSPSLSSGRAILFPWGSHVLEYVGLCTHDAMIEGLLDGITAKDKSLTPEFYAAREAAARKSAAVKLDLLPEEAVARRRLMNRLRAKQAREILATLPPDVQRVVKDKTNARATAARHARLAAMSPEERQAYNKKQVELATKYQQNLPSERKKEIYAKRKAREDNDETRAKKAAYIPYDARMGQAYQNPKTVGLRSDRYHRVSIFLRSYAIEHIRQ